MSEEENHRAVVKNIIMCDDIRREESGKNILIGVYGPQIVLESLPATFLISLWGRFELDGTAPIKASMRILGEGDSPIWLVESVMIEPGNRSLSVTGIRAQFQDVGALKFQISQADGDWETAEVVAVVLPDTRH